MFKGSSKRVLGAFRGQNYTRGALAPESIEPNLVHISISLQSVWVVCHNSQDGFYYHILQL